MIMKNRCGFTLTELMVSVVIISTVIFVIVEVFGSIQKAIQFSKDRTIAVNLAQEKMQILRGKSYYRVIPSTYIAYLTDFSPAIPYDTYYFPPETVLEAGVYYTRYVYITPVTESGGNILELPPQSADTGMKKITITVVWKHIGKKKKVSISSIYTNPNTVMGTASINGRIRNKNNFLPVQGAVVNVPQYLGANTVSDISGNYDITLIPGNYTLYVNARGYFPYLSQFSVGSNQTVTKNVDLTPMAYGKMTGVAWLVDHLVITQIVGSTVAPDGFEQEYIEIFNPTTYTWTVDGNIGLRFQRIYDTSKKNILIDYINSTIPPGGFYLFANTQTVIVNGVYINADALWSESNSSSDFPYFNPPSNQYNIIPINSDGPDEGGGAIELYRISDGKILDQVGWNRNYGASGKKYAPFYETSAIPQNIGLQSGEQYVRYSSTSGVNVSYGPSYDSNNNSVDFKNYLGISVLPSNSSITKPVISGTPASGAVISCSDGLSVSTIAYTLSTPPYSYFELNEVATGTWSCSISSDTYAFVYDNLTFTAGSTLTLNSVFLTTEITWGYVSGMVTDVYANNITPAIKIVSSNGEYTYVNNKRYLLTVATGVINVTANPGNLNQNYVSISSNALTISPGEIKSGVDFVLYHGGRISGKIVISGSTTPISGVGVAILDSYGSARDQQITDNNGWFITNVLSTGSYVVQPIVDSREIVTPSTKTVNLITAGSTVFSSTFSLSNAVGYITGNVKFNNQPIKTGVLIVVTTVTLSGVIPQPPTLSSQTLTGPPYYITSSYEDGSYLVEVRQSTNPRYNVYAYYSDLSGSSFVIYWSSKTNISVIGGQTTGGINFIW